jgi:hypothetical protein
METINTMENVETDLLYYLEMGDLSVAKGLEQEALEFYLRGLQRAKDLQDRARIQQFSNLIYTYL